MKKTFLNLSKLLTMAVAILAVGFTSCKKEPVKVPTLPKITIQDSEGVEIADKATISMISAVDSKEITITATRNWAITTKVSAEAAWLTVAPTNGNSDKVVKVILSATKNESGEARSATLTIKATDGSTSKEITVRQVTDVLPSNQITVAALRALPVGAISSDKIVVGNIISDASAAGGSSVSKKNIVMQDATAGIMIRLAVDPATPYALGEEVQVTLNGLLLYNSYGPLQLNNVPATAVTKTGAPHAPVAAKSITPTQLLTGDFESQYVAVSDVQFISDAVGKAINDADFNTSGHASVKMESKDKKELSIFVAKYAAFYIAPMTIPAKSGVIKGIAGDKQVQPQTLVDFEGLTEERFAETPRFGVSSLAVNVPSAGGDATVNVTGNVAWTAVVKDGAGNLTSGPTPANGATAASIVLKFPANMDETATKTVTLTVSTTNAEITEKSFDIVFTQAKALPAGEKMVVFDIPAMGIGNAIEWGVRTIDGITITAAGGGNTNTPKYYTSGTSLHTYKDNTLTFTGNNIIKIEVETGGTRKDGFTVAPGTLEGTIWTGSANSVVFTTAPSIDNSQHHYAKLTVTYNPAE